MVSKDKNVKGEDGSNGIENKNREMTNSNKSDDKEDAAGIKTNTQRRVKAVHFEQPENPAKFKG